MQGVSNYGKVETPLRQNKSYKSQHKQQAKQRGGPGQQTQCDASRGRNHARRGRCGSENCARTAQVGNGEERAAEKCRGSDQAGRRDPTPRLRNLRAARERSRQRSRGLADRGTGSTSAVPKAAERLSGPSDLTKASGGRIPAADLRVVCKKLRGCLARVVLKK